MLARLESGDRDRRVEHVRQADRDEVEVRLGKQCLPVGVGGAGADLLPNLVSAVHVRVAHGADLDAGGDEPGDMPFLRDRAAADDPGP